MPASEVDARGISDWSAPIGTTSPGALGNAPPRPFQQNTPHDLAANGKEMAAMLPVHIPCIDQLQMDLVNQSRCLKRSPRLLIPHEMPSDKLQFVIDTRRKLVQGGPGLRSPMHEEVAWFLFVRRPALEAGINLVYSSSGPVPSSHEKTIGQFKFFSPVCTCRANGRKTMATPKLTIFLLIAPLAAHASSIAKPHHTLAVCVDNDYNYLDRWTLSQALTIVSGIFEKIALDVEWRHNSTECPAEGVRVTISYETTEALASGVLAWANPDDRTVRLFYHRILLRDGNSGTPFVLAHVLTHEITHILQGAPRHSSSGIMKAHWTLDDLARMRVLPLRFSDEDIELIDRGLSRQPQNSLAARSSAILDATIADR